MVRLPEGHSTYFLSVSHPAIAAYLRQATYTLLSLVQAETVRRLRCGHCHRVLWRLRQYVLSWPLFSGTLRCSSKVSFSVTGDVHTITGGWGDASLPLCVGHEIIGKVIKVGSKVTLAKIGQRVGVGAMISACMKCKNCTHDNENYCPKGIGRCFCSLVSVLNHLADDLPFIVQKRTTHPTQTGRLLKAVTHPIFAPTNTSPSPFLTVSPRLSPRP